MQKALNFNGKSYVTSLQSVKCVNCNFSWEKFGCHREQI